MELKEIEYKISCNEMNAAQVFTQMKQHIPRENIESDEDLDKRMVAAGMIPLSEILKQDPLGKFSAHKGISGLDDFESWLTMRRKETARMFTKRTLDKKENDDLFEWILAHSAVFGEVMANFRQATGRSV